MIGTLYTGKVHPSYTSTAGYRSEFNRLIVHTSALLWAQKGSFVTIINFGQPSELTIIWEIESAHPSS